MYPPYTGSCSISPTQFSSFPCLIIMQTYSSFPIKRKNSSHNPILTFVYHHFSPLDSKMPGKGYLLVSPQMVSSILCEFVKKFPRLLSLVFYKIIRTKRSKVFLILRKQVHKCVQTFLFPTKNVLFLTVLVW